MLRRISIIGHISIARRHFPLSRHFSPMPISPEELDFSREFIADIIRCAISIEGDGRALHAKLQSAMPHAAKYTAMTTLTLAIADRGLGRAPGPPRESLSLIAPLHRADSESMPTLCRPTAEY